MRHNAIPLFLQQHVILVGPHTEYLDFTAGEMSTAPAFIYVLALVPVGTRPTSLLHGRPEKFPGLVHSRILDITPMHMHEAVQARAREVHSHKIVYQPDRQPASQPHPWLLGNL